MKLVNLYTKMTSRPLHYYTDFESQFVRWLFMFPHLGFIRTYIADFVIGDVAELIILSGPASLGPYMPRMKRINPSKETSR